MGVIDHTDVVVIVLYYYLTKGHPCVKYFLVLFQLACPIGQIGTSFSEVVLYVHIHCFTIIELEGIVFQFGSLLHHPAFIIILYLNHIYFITPNQKRKTLPSPITSGRNFTSGRRLNNQYTDIYIKRFDFVSKWQWSDKSANQLSRQLVPWKFYSHTITTWRNLCRDITPPPIRTSQPTLHTHCVWQL